MFGSVPLADPDPMFGMNAAYNADTFAQKVNLGIGAYRDDTGKPWVLPAVKNAEKWVVGNESLNHEYLSIEGLQSFTDSSARFILGNDSAVIAQKRYAAVQTISGTGAVRLGAEFLARFFKGAKVLVSRPTWGNHKNIFQDAGIEVAEYRYWNSSGNDLDFAGMTADINAAPSGSIILLHACAHNPTGTDPTDDQWEKLATLCQQKQHIVFFDSAYQGFASGDLDKDAFAVRHFASRGIDFLLAQSYSKNFGLYNERCGCLVVTTRSADEAEKVRSQMARLIRPLYSNPPAFGARIVNHVLNDAQLYKEWESNLKTMAGRIHTMREHLQQALVKRGTPGTWNHIVEQIGMFSYTGLTPPQVKCLKEKYHIYLTDNGRISMAGINTKNVDYVADAIDFAVRNFKSSARM